MKNIIASIIVAAGAVAFAMPATAVTGSAPAADNLTICATEGAHGWKLEGIVASNFTDWQTNRAIGELIGDGNCQEGWQMVSEGDPRIFEQLGMSNTSRSNFSVNTVLDSSVEKVDAGKLRLLNSRDDPIAAYNPAPVIINKDTGAKKKLVGWENGEAKYKIVRQGDFPNAPAVGTVQNWNLGNWVIKNEMFRYPDDSGDCYQGFNCHKARYWASRDITTTEGQTDRYVTVRTERFHCPTQWSYAHVAPTGETFVYTQDAKPCTRKVSWSQRKVDTSNWTRTNVGDKYIDHDRLFWNQ